MEGAAVERIADANNGAERMQGGRRGRIKIKPDNHVLILLRAFVRQSQISQSVVARAVTMRMSSALPHHSRKTFASSGVPLRSRVRMEEVLAAFQLSCRVGADAGYRLPHGLLLLREPVADVRDVVEDETADFRAGRTETAGSQALQRAHGASLCRNDKATGPTIYVFCFKKLVRPSNQILSAGRLQTYEHYSVVSAGLKLAGI